MGRLFDNIRAAIGEDRYAISDHGDDRLRDRAIELWQLVGAIDEARILSERPSDQPNPSVELEQLLPDGTSVKTVWAWVESHSLAVLVTVHYL